jgi:mannose-6-phosphate isomerase
MGPGIVILETQQTSDLTYRMYDYGSARELHLDKSFAAMRLKTPAGKVPPQRIDGHTLLIDERYFRIERWPIRPGSALALLNPMPVVQMLFVTDGRLMISGDGSTPFAVEPNQIVVIPAATTRWSLVSEGLTEVIRILPAAGPSAAVEERFATERHP